MPNNPALASLRDIHLPNALSLWPLAPGYYVIILLIALISLTALLTFYYFQQNLAKREALTQLNEVLSSYERDHNHQAAILGVSMLLKRVALAYYPRENVASLHTIAWVNFLETHSKKLDFSKVKNILIKGPYQIHYIDNSIPELFTLAKQWIKQRRGRRV